MGSYADLDHWALGRQYNEFMTRFDQIQEILNQRRRENRHLLRPQEWVWQSWGEAATTDSPAPKHQSANLVAPELGFNAYNLHPFALELPPGEAEGAYHTHGEAIKFYLQGKGKEIIGETEYEVEAGDVMLVPADVWHGTQNPYSETVRFLACAHAGAGAPMFRQPVFRTRDDLKTRDREFTRRIAALAERDYAALERRQFSQVRHHLLQELGDIELEMLARRGTARHVMKQSELEWGDLSQEIGTAPWGRSPRIAKAICPELGFPAYNFLAYFIEIPDGRTEPVYHKHGEEMKYFLQGRGRERIGDQAYPVEQGDIIFVPANTWHYTENSADEPLTFFSITQARGTPVAMPALLAIR
jgi:mannose-6-phosphate isomerase-like protein (cupin superfamily)